MKGLLRDEGGQAVIEYMLALVIAISICTIIGMTFRRTLFAVWRMMGKEIAAGCPGCPIGPDVIR
jgi:Flp pilus assembly pilin Flp